MKREYRKPITRVINVATTAFLADSLPGGGDIPDGVMPGDSKGSYDDWEED